MNNFMKLLEEAETSNNNLKFKELLKRVYEISKSYNKEFMKSQNLIIK